jgi:nitrogen fixation NifU-like protein
MLEELYQDIILEYSENTEFCGAHGGTCPLVVLNNPLCGDRLSIWLEMNGDVVSSLRFEADGCMISRASAAMAVSHVQGKTRAEIYDFISEFKRMFVERDFTDAETKGFGDLQALEGVGKFPARVRCALLAFEAIERALTETVNAVNTKASTTAAVSDNS